MSDGNGGSDTITVTITITDVVENVAPVFTDGATTTRSIAENTAAGTNIGTAVAATDVNTSDTLTYTLSGTDASSFAIVSTSGQLQTKSALNYEQKSSYSVTVSVSDGNGGSDSITVTINITNVVNEGAQQSNVNVAPVFTDGATTTRSIAENTAAGTNIGTAIAATDANTSDTLTYTLSGTDASSFAIVSTSGQLQTKSALNYEQKSSYSVTVSVSDGNGGSDSITVTINITNVVNEGAQQSNVNVAPVFTDGATTTRSIAENTAAGTNIGTAIAATDANTSDTLTYTLSGTDVSSFAIVSTSGQLQTKSALNYEQKSFYSVTVSVSDGNGGSDSITVTINITNVVNEGAQQSNVNVAPVFTDGATTTRSIAENTAAGTNIGTAIAATDANTSDTLTYTLSGTDASSFAIVSTSGQLQTKSALNYEQKSFYSVTVSVSDGNGGSDSITVTINITNVVNEGAQQSNVNVAPVFTDGATTTRSIAENTAAGTNIGTAIAATDANTSDTLTYTLSGTDASSFAIVSTSGQLQTKSALNYEQKSFYSVTVSVSDGNGGSDSITVTINITNVVNEGAQQSNVNVAPVFTDGATTTRSIAENTAAGTNIGTAIAATDANTSDTLTYTLSGTDASSFAIVSTSGQLQTKSALNYEQKSSYSVTVSVSDGNGGSDSITVTINITNVVNEGAQQSNVNVAPVFTDGATTTRSIAENTAAGTNIGTAIAATDANTSDTLTYTLGGTNAASFSIVSTSGQLKTRSDLDYETKSSYSVTISVSDGNGKDTITVTISITESITINVVEAPDPAVSSRTEAVRNAIVSAVSDASSPSDITGTHLSGITSLDISSSSVSSLSAGDFNGLTSLETLNLSSNAISSLPNNIFDDLGSLTSLDISGNFLTSLPDGIFSVLSSLSTLDLSSNAGNLSVVLSIEKVDHADNSLSPQGE